MLQTASLRFNLINEEDNEWVWVKNKLKSSNHLKTLQHNNNLIWLVVFSPLWKIWVSQFSWDDDIPNMMGKTKVMVQTTNQWLTTIIGI